MNKKTAIEYLNDLTTDQLGNSLLNESLSALDYQAIVDAYRILKGNNPKAIVAEINKKVKELPNYIDVASYYAKDIKLQLRMRGKK